MLYAFSWTLMLLLLALWSLAAWALDVVSHWTISNAGALGGAGIQGLRLPEWLAPWVPTEMAQWLATLLAGLGPLVDTLLQGAPALAGGLSVVIWTFWGIGSVLLLVLGVGAHLLISLWRRRGGAGLVRPAGAMPAV